jgi:hypothetical protein
MSLFARFLRAAAPGRRGAGRPSGLRRPRPVLESLEGREVPAVLPTLSPIGRQFDRANTPLAVNFTVADRTFPASTLTVTATSGNTAVVPNSGLTVLGASTNRTLVISPAAGQVGVTSVTLRVQDPDGGFVTAVVPVLVTATQALPFADSFNRADGVFLGVGWDEDAGAFAVKANQGAAVAPAAAVATVDGVFAADVAPQADVALAAGQSVGLVARYAGPGDRNWYAGQLVRTATGVSAQVIRNVNGVRTTLASRPVPGTGTGTLRFEAAGPSLKLFLNNTLVAFADDATLTAPGSVGVRVTGAAAFDNFSAAALTLTQSPLPFTENFNLATNQQLGPVWLNQAGSLQVAGGVGTGLAKVDVATVNGIRAADVFAQADVNVSGAVGRSAGLVARYAGPADHNLYMGRLVRTATGYLAQLVRDLNGVRTTLFSRPVVGATGTGTLRFEAAGPSLKLFLNNTLVAFANDSGLKTGTVGIVTSAGAGVDNFSADILTLTNAIPPFNDNFGTATNQQLSSSWLNRAGNFQVAGGVATGVGPLNLATLNGFSTANVTVQADVNVAGAAGRSAGLVGRSSGPGDTNNYFAGLVNTGAGFRVELWRTVNGVRTRLTSHTVATGSGTLKLVLSGTSLTVFFNNVQVLSATDTGIAGPGTVGMRASAGATVDNFSAN